jgi:hypothetical protein
VNVKEIAETKQQFRECLDETQLVDLVRTYEQVLNAPVHVEISISILDEENQPRRGGFRRKGWHDGRPLPVDSESYHLEFPPIQPEATIVHGDYRDNLEAGLSQCFNDEKALALLSRVEDGKRPAELELRAYSLFLLGSEDAHSASPVTLGRIRLGRIDARGITVTRTEEVGSFKQETEMLQGKYASVAELDRAILAGNVLFSAVSESTEAADLLGVIRDDLGLLPKQVEWVNQTSGKDEFFAQSGVPRFRSSSPSVERR